MYLYPVSIEPDDLLFWFLLIAYEILIFLSLSLVMVTLVTGCLVRKC